MILTAWASENDGQFSTGAQEALHNWGEGHNNLSGHLYGEELHFYGVTVKTEGMCPLAPCSITYELHSYTMKSLKIIKNYSKSCLLNELSN